MADEDVWRRRFYLFMGARLFGLLTFLLGLVIVFTDLGRPGGWPVVGAIVMLMGIADSFFAPKLMKRAWEKEDQEKA